MSSTADPNLKRGCFRTLRGVSLAHGVLPTSYFLSGVELASTIPHALGGFADIWRGQRDGSQVCVKAFRIDTTADPDKIKRVCSSFLSRREGQLNLISKRGSTVKLSGGSPFHIRMCYHSSEFRRLCSRFVSSLLGFRTEISSSTLREIIVSIGYSW